MRTLVDDFAQQLYLPRLAGPGVLTAAPRSGVALLTWQLDAFAYSELFEKLAVHRPDLLRHLLGLLVGSFRSLIACEPWETHP